MDAMLIMEWTVKVVIAIGGLGGIAALFMVTTQKRKLMADTGKTDAEANAVLETAQSTRTAREISMIEPYERIQARMQHEMDDLYAEIDRLKAWAESLAGVLEANGLTVPPMPPKKKLAVPPMGNLAAHAE